MRARRPGSRIATSGARAEAPLVRPRRLLVSGAACWLAAGCGLAQLQTAKTTPRGKVRTTIGGTVVTSGLDNARRPGSASSQDISPNFPLPIHLEVRGGLSDRVDIGGK